MRKLFQSLAVAVVFTTAAVAAPARPEPRRALPSSVSTSLSPAVEAERALFISSDSAQARVLAGRALTRARSLPPGAARRREELEALFVEMEAASLQADTDAALGAAVRICELGVNDPRATIAAARILDSAANTRAFRTLAERVRRLASGALPQQPYMAAALVAAAADGLPGESVARLARAAGYVTDWSMVGGFGEFQNLDFDRAWPPERDALHAAQYGDRAVERFRFEDGFAALPSYFAHDGVFYAAGETVLAHDGEWTVRLESGGTAAVFVDGRLIVTRDDRGEDQPLIASQPVRLRAGAHRVVVKFLPTAAPFRVAMLPALSAPRQPLPTVLADESRYLSAAEHYWAGDFDSVTQRYMGTKRMPAVAAFLLAQAWARSSPGASEEPEFLRQALAADRNALAASLALARRDLQDGRADQALAEAQAVVAQRPSSSAALELLAQIAARLQQFPEAKRAFDAAADLHPSCSLFSAAATSFAAMEQYRDAAAARERLAGCASGSLAYAEALAAAGHNAEAAAAAQQIVLQHPLDRPARELLVRQLWAAGEREPAHAAAEELAALAPNSPQARALVAQTLQSIPALLTDAGDRSDFLTSTEFYAPYRRDGIREVRHYAQRSFSGGPAVFVLADRVTQLRDDGAASVYVHHITRVLNRDGIERYGEVTLPPCARVLELRTVKQDGSVVEPELNHAKQTITMPALAPGDSIDEEYVCTYREHDSIESHAERFRFTFGSFAAPILTARFVVLAPKGVPLTTENDSGAPAPQVRDVAGTVIRMWERDNVSQSVTEIAQAGDALPAVRVLPASAAGWASVRDFYRNLLVDATHVGPRVAQAAAEAAGASDEERARQLYRGVTRRIRSAQLSWADPAVVSAEETLQEGEGSRTAALLAVARTAHLHADLVLAREADAPPPLAPARGSYSRPLVRFAFPDAHGGPRYVFADAESDGLAFGALPPALDRDRALLVANDAPDFVPLPPAGAGEQSAADADVTIDANGNLDARLHIVMGSWRSVQMRALLRPMGAAQRQQFFSQLASRIFPGATAPDGEVRNEDDPDKPVELLVSCRAPRFVDFGARTIEIDQLVPTLGLRKLFATGADRKFPLRVDAPLFESATFHVHLPADVAVQSKPGDFELRSPFGAYQAHFLVANRELTVRRSFDVPVQTVAPARFREFARFADAIDELERQRLTLAPASQPMAETAAGK